MPDSIRGRLDVVRVHEARLVARVVHAHAYKPLFYLSPSCRMRVATSFFTRRFGSGLSIAKCSDPFVCSSCVTSLPSTGSTEPLWGRSLRSCLDAGKPAHV